MRSMKEMVVKELDETLELVSIVAIKVSEHEDLLPAVAKVVARLYDECIKAGLTPEVAARVAAGYKLESTK